MRLIPVDYQSVCPIVREHEWIRGIDVPGSHGTGWVVGLDLKHHSQGAPVSFVYELARLDCAMPENNSLYITTKRCCTKCHRALPVGDFYKKGDSKDGIHTWCKDCVQGNSKRWRKADRERTKEVDRRNYAANGEHRKLCIKRWKVANPGKVLRYRNARRVQRVCILCEEIDPLEIFERDKWRCRLCRRKTPQELRGTREPNAPELDHIIPLSLGGPHTRKNVQCLCATCNRKKSAKYEGQLAFA